ncbi:LysR family transcriptional regulator [Hyphococcus sp. DH-69]|uniref:LysR family transcriptional regulator n=1 Tax=Hyphococcus formosus TaxID=3143534 RepID=UPI00398B026E
MNWQAVSFDWNQARAFLATAEEGSLSAAARALGVTQPTLSRQVSALEHNLGVTLFERGTRNMVLTEAGLELLDHVRAMFDAASRVSLTASGQSQSIKGAVKISTTNNMATFHLPAIVAEIRAIYPEIEINITTSNAVRDLTRREADIAIRHGRPTQPELIAKLVRETTAHLYASTEYLDKKGNPQTINDILDADFIGFEYPEQLIPAYAERGIHLTRKNFPINTESGTAIIEMIRRGLGIGILLREEAVKFPELECVLPDLEPITVPVWLATHRELHTSRRIRLVFDILAERLNTADY